MVTQSTAQDAKNVHENEVISSDSPVSQDPDGREANPLQKVPLAESTAEHQEERYSAEQQAGGKDESLKKKHFSFIPKALPSMASGDFSSPLARCIVIAVLAIVLQLPVGSVKDIVYERMSLYNTATGNIAASWGMEQAISGPSLIIPYVTWKDHKEVVVETVDGRNVQQERSRREYYTCYKVVLPENVHFNAKMDTEIRYRGIYRKTLYEAPVDIKGSFILPKTEQFGANLHEILWEKAWLGIGITNVRAISEEKPLQWDGTSLSGNKPGTDADYLLGAGFHAALPLTEKLAGTAHDFSLYLKIRGSGAIAFTPVGEQSTITIEGSWPHPSFQGNLLPAERSITENGFSATWNISNLTRTYPQLGDLHSNDYNIKAGQSAITQFTVGVGLHENVSLYRMVIRAVQYAILFLAVSFVAMFSFEILSRQQMHILQYGMVGLSMALFYLVLLSLAEHMDFDKAFTAAAALTVLMNSLYVASAMGRKIYGLMMAGILSALYGLLFFLLRMEDFALLMGTGLVVVLMGVLMFVTRKLPQARTA